MLCFPMLRPRHSPPSSSAPPPRTPNPIGALGRQISSFDLQLSTFNSCSSPHGTRLTRHGTRRLFSRHDSAPTRAQTRHTRHTRVEATSFPSIACALSQKLDFLQLLSNQNVAHSLQKHPGWGAPSALPNRAQTRHTRHAGVGATPIPSYACAHFPSPMGVALRAHFPILKGYSQVQPPRHLAGKNRYLRAPHLCLWSPAVRDEPRRLRFACGGSSSRTGHGTPVTGHEAEIAPLCFHALTTTLAAYQIAGAQYPPAPGGAPWPQIASHSVAPKNATPAIVRVALRKGDTREES